MDQKNKKYHSRKKIEVLRESGIVKLKENDMFSMWVKISCCNVNSNQLKKLADITDKYARGYLLFSTRQIPIIPHIHSEDVEEVKRELGQVYLELDRCGPRVRNINVCYDDKICPDAETNSISLAEKLEIFFHDPIHHKIKIGVAGCKKDCILSRVLNDISFIGVGTNGTDGYYDVYVGGRLGLNPFVGVKMAQRVSEDRGVKFVQNYFDLLRNEGISGERGADIINRLGMKKIKQELSRDLYQGTSLKPIGCKTKLEAKENNRMILRVRATCGEVTSIQLRRIADIAERYGQGLVHFTVRGSPEIPCTGKKNLENIRTELQEVDLQILDKGIDNIQTCFGEYCGESNADTQSLLKKIERVAEELELNNLNIKISAAGCPNSCGIGQLNDIGFLGIVEPEVDIDSCTGCELCIPLCKRKAIELKDDVVIIDKETCKYCGQCIALCPFDAIIEKRKGFAIFIGGCGGEDTRLGEVIEEFISEEEALLLTERCLKLVKDKDVNLSTLVDELGMKGVKEIQNKSE